MRFVNHIRKSEIVVKDKTHLAELILEHSRLTPHFVELVADGNRAMMIGIGGNLCSVQYTVESGRPPYLVAKGGFNGESDEVTEFMMEDTPTQVPKRLCISLEQTLSIVMHFFENHEPLQTVEWESI